MHLQPCNALGLVRSTPAERRRTRTRSNPGGRDCPSVQTPCPGANPRSPCCSLVRCSTPDQHFHARRRHHCDCMLPHQRCFAAVSSHLSPAGTSETVKCWHEWQFSPSHKGGSQTAGRLAPTHPSTVLARLQSVYDAMEALEHLPAAICVCRPRPFLRANTRSRVIKFRKIVSAIQSILWSLQEGMFGIAGRRLKHGLACPWPGTTVPKSSKAKNIAVRLWPQETPAGA